MKDYFLVIAIFLAGMGNNWAEDTTHSGVVRVEGIITEKTCIIADQSKNFTVNMPDVPSSEVRNAGSVTQKVKFAVTLTRCGSAVNNAFITFEGAAVAEDTALYQLENGSVDGLALAIFDNNKNTIGNGLSSAGYSLIPLVDNTLQFYAAYTSVANNVQPGPANASVSFVVTYD